MKLCVNNAGGFELDVPGFGGGVEVAAGHAQRHCQQSDRKMYV